MKSLANKVFVVTGAGSGIGRHLALQLAEQGAKLALTDIDKENLDDTVTMTGLSKENCIAKKIDVSSRAAMYKFAEQVEKHFGEVHCVINNAGVSVADAAEDTSYDDFKWLMDINFWGVVYGTKAFLPALKKSPQSYVVNISSVFGLIGFPSQSAYNASKFAVRGFTEALRVELKGTSVLPICVHPGGIKTNIVKNTRFYKVAETGLDHSEAMKVFENLAFTLPEQAARVIIQGIKKRNRRVLIGPDARLYDAMARFFPNSYDRIIDKVMSFVS